MAIPLSALVRSASALAVLALASFASLLGAARGEEWVTMNELDALMRRLEQTENSLLELQEHNRWLERRLSERPALFYDDQPPMQLLPPVTDPPGDAADGAAKPDEAGADEAGAEGVEEEGSKKEEEEDEGEEEEEKEKEWYEKISLRGYAQFRYNYVTHLSQNSAPPNYAGDSSIAPDQEFLIRRARMIFYGDISDHLYVYFQPDFASTPDGSTNNIYFTQIRDWYGDVYLDRCKVHRFRIGQSKIPYGWENLQSSQNRLYLDRNDAFNSAARNERDLGVFYYWTPMWAQDTFKFISDEGLKGSGNYGIFGLGVYNGQGGSLRELNDNLHLISRLTLPLTLASGQIVEFGIQGYTGEYVVNGAAIRPLGVAPAVTPFGTRNNGGQEGLLDQRLGWTLVYYPQPLGFQIEHTIGRGPELNPSQTAVEVSPLHGGYAMVNYRYETANHGEFWPFLRWQYYDGGYKSFANAPDTRVNEWNIGLEWQIRKEMELVCEYLITDRTNLQAQAVGQSYEQFVGNVLRFQFQVNF